MIKKVSNSQSNAYEIPGAKFKAPVACDDTSCNLQCTCQYPIGGGEPNLTLQYVFAMNFYCSHNDNWN
jgi:hypothetical protein